MPADGRCDSHKSFPSFVSDIYYLFDIIIIVQIVILVVVNLTTFDDSCRLIQMFCPCGDSLQFAMATKDPVVI